MEPYYRNIFYYSPGVDCVFDKETKTICDVNANFEQIIGNKMGTSINELFVNASDLVQFIHTVGAFSGTHELFEMETNSVNNEKFKLKWRLTDLRHTNKILLSGTLSQDNSKAMEDAEAPFPFTKSELITLVQTAPVCIHCVVDGVIVWANQTLLNVLGLEPEEYIGTFPLKRIVDPKAIYEAALRVKAGEVVHNFPHRMIAKDGTIKYFTCEFDSFRRADGSTINRGFLRHDAEGHFDQTIANEQVQKFAEIAAEKDAFIRIMFHEMKTPLHNLTVGFNTFLIEAKLDNSVTDDLRFQIDRCAGTVEDLSFATMFESDQVLHPRPINISLRKELDIIVDHVNHEMKLSNKSIQIERQFEEGMPEVFAVDKSILRVMTNLISNAVKYCTSDGSVVISLSYKSVPSAASMNSNDSVKLSESTPGFDHKFVFSVTNNVSKAMDQVKVNKMFQNCFNRFKASPANSSGRNDKSAAISQSLMSSDGLGLGVFVAYNIVQCLGGLLECSGDNLYTNFTFSADVARPRESLSSKASDPSNQMMWSNAADSNVGTKHVVSDTCEIWSKSSGSQDGIRKSSHPSVMGRIPMILVVDDSPICRKVLVKLLESNGYATKVACDGKEACDLLVGKFVPYHMVLMDLRMPIMDGITATRIIKERAHCANLPIVIVTAETGEDVKNECMAAKANYFISKPVRMNELLEVIEKFINMG